MYGRSYGDRELRFEASGGLMHYSLVMRDKETDSYWSLMSGEALAGELEGTRLIELPVGIKTQWKDWLAEHPETLVLSIEGVEHEETNPYEEYFRSEKGFRDSAAEDERLPTKSPIYSFQLGGYPYAIPYAVIEEGAAFTVGEARVFVYRPTGAEVFRSTAAFRSAVPGRFERRDGIWLHLPSGARFDPAAGTFQETANGPVPLEGFDTFWFNWSMNHPDSAILTETD